MNKALATDSELTKRLDIIREDIRSAHYFWILYKELVDSTFKYSWEVREFGGDLFGAIREAIAARVILAIARTVDPPESKKGKANISLPAVTKRWLTEGDWGSRVDHVRSELVRLRNYRNQFVAHGDDDAHFSDREKQSPLLERDIDKCLRELTELMIDIDEHVGVPRTQYDRPIRFGNWPALFEGLRAGLRAKGKDEHERIVAQQSRRSSPE